MPDPIQRPGVLGVSILSEPPGPSSSRPVVRPPRTPIEQAVTEIWQAVLARELFDPDASFFEIGGDSLLATQVAARVRQLFGVELALPDLFETPTVAGMAERVQAGLCQEPGSQLPPLVPTGRTAGLPLSFTQERMWFIQALDPHSAAYHVALAVRLRGPLDIHALEASFNQLVQRHAALRTTFSAHTSCIGVFPSPQSANTAPFPFRTTHSTRDFWKSNRKSGRYVASNPSNVPICALASRNAR